MVKAEDKTPGKWGGGFEPVVLRTIVVRVTILQELKVSSASGTKCTNI